MGGSTVPHLLKIAKGVHDQGTDKSYQSDKSPSAECSLKRICRH